MTAGSMTILNKQRFPGSKSKSEIPFHGDYKVCSHQEEDSGHKLIRLASQGPILYSGNIGGSDIKYNSC